MQLSTWAQTVSPSPTLAVDSLAKALKAVGYKGLRLSGNGVKSSVFTDGAKAAGEGWYLSCGGLAVLTAESSKQFVAVS